MQKWISIGLRRKMKGMSNWEAFSFLILVGGYFFIGMNLYEPLWDRWKIYGILETTMAEEDTLKQEKSVIASRILKRMSVNNIYGVTQKDFKIQRTDKTIRLTFNKSLPASMPFDIDVNVKVNKVIEAKRVF
ncbi:MAG TPA: hypothetical protein DHW71_06095 [Gammaproteobacteria bacterium]|nr:hypothetical protein [Gammaproteobacteria bacterium]MEC8010901.1 DUF4845 domain-containing protein [Pseudomonadota bacterium]HBF06798.1 hypothetical protein [Gammaproteobacteria bacterium]HCK92536.1 hypothetical protein [Gammaproteobacteria bacterium]|tara:strand:- start:1012 stop:1407 length:396 start_codon:yes stop_codon:yes gene_type:complete